MSEFLPLLQFGDYADLYWEESATVGIRWEEGKIERFNTGREAGVGLRYMQGDENRYAFSDEPSSPTNLARQLQGRGLRARPTPIAKAKPLQLYRPKILKPIDQVSAETKANLLAAAFRAASLPHIRQISSNYGESVKRIRVLTSDGDQTEEWRTTITFSISVVAEKDGLLQTAYEAFSGTGGFELFEKYNVEKLAKLVAKRALDRLNAPPAPAGEMPVIIAAEAGGTLIHEAIGHPLEADAVQKDVSPVYKNAVGKVVGNEKVNVLEDPTMPGQRGFYAFDDEGVPAQRAVLVDHGVLKTYIYDRQTAMKDGLPSNGHGRRESFRHRPIPRMANTFVAPGPDDPQMILRSIPNGLLVTRMGGGQVEPATGDFVFEVEEGFLIKDGQVGSLIRSANLLGNGPDVLKAIDLVGSDMGWSVGTCGKDGQGAPVSDGLPTLRIPKGVVIGGIAS